MSIIHPTNESKNVYRTIENSVYDSKKSSYGCSDFIKLSELNDYLYYDSLLVECMIHPAHKNIYIKPSTIINESLSMEDSVLFTDKLDYYPIQNRPHAKGYICIIKNSQFVSSIYPSLVGYETDVEKIHTVCTTNLAIDKNDIETHHNLSSVKMLAVFDNLSKKDFTRYDYLMIFILSHGHSGCIMGTDTVTIPYLHLQQYFYPSRCNSLKDKPKCFFLQGCRSSLSTKPSNNLGAVGSISNANASTIEPTKSTLSVVTKPHNFSEEEADFLFACACVDFSIAWINTQTGSWYITQLCKYLAYFSHSHHLLDMLIKVNQLLYKMNKDVEKYGVVSQISVPSHTFTRKFRFFENKEIEHKQTEISVSSSSSSSASSSNKDMIYAPTLTKSRDPFTPLRKVPEAETMRLQQERLAKEVEARKLQEGKVAKEAKERQLQQERSAREEKWRQEREAQIRWRQERERSEARQLEQKRLEQAPAERKFQSDFIAQYHPGWRNEQVRRYLPSNPDTLLTQEKQLSLQRKHC